MTLSLDDVRNKRFRMARKSGYEVLEVDEFVDEVEETFGQLVEENQNLKKQVDALKTPSPTAAAPSPAPQSAPAPVRQPTAPSSQAETVVVTTSKEASTAVVRLVELSAEQAERLVEEATEEAARIRDEANRAAHQVTTDARTRAERVESEARVNAERMHADALSRAEKLEREIENRRTQMFGDLEKQRDELASTVNALRKFEATYRSNLTAHLRGQIESLQSGRTEPADVPQAVRKFRAVDSAPGNGPDRREDPAGGRSEREDAPGRGETRGTSDTPRLDALLGEQR